MNTIDAHAAALATFLNISPVEVTPLNWDHYGLPQFSAEGAEYAVGTDEEADEAGTEAVRQSLWAFNASFIVSQCDLPMELEDAIKGFCEAKCEDANEAIEALVEKCCRDMGKDGVEAFADAAFSADGRGHFLSGYDGEENEVQFEHEEGDSQTFYVYRTN